MGEHLINGEFQSDKYLWCLRGFVPLKLTDPSARLVLRIYAELRRDIDEEFSNDLIEAIRIKETEKTDKLIEKLRLALSDAGQSLSIHGDINNSAQAFRMSMIETKER